jgi:anti-sigma B factor antagonist
MTDTEPVTPARVQPVVVTLPAEIDMANADAAGEQLAAAFAAGVVVIADMTGTTFCDSTGVRMLVQARQQAMANHTDLRLVVPHAYVRRTLGRMGVGELLSIYLSFQEALTRQDG